MSKHVINTCQNVVLWQRKVSAHCLQSMIDCVIGSWFIVVKSSGWLSTRTEYGRFDRQMHVVLWIIVIACYFEFYSMKKHTHFQYIVDAISFSSELKFLWIHIVSSFFFVCSNRFEWIQADILCTTFSAAYQLQCMNHLPLCSCYWIIQNKNDYVWKNKENVIMKYAF